MINVPNTFQAGTKARANEVNENFNVVYQATNDLSSDVADMENRVDYVEQNKADKQGDATVVFRAGDAINDYDVVNKQTLMGYLSTSLSYINGLSISKDPAYNNHILIDSGSCYDSTKTKPMELNGVISVANDTQAANSTYYVYLIASEDARNVTGLISTADDEPPLPSGYMLYRRLGHYTTSSSNVIQTVISEKPSATAFSNLSVSPTFGSQFDLSSYLQGTGLYVVLLYWRLENKGTGNSIQVQSDIFDNTTVGYCGGDAGRHSGTGGIAPILVGPGKWIKITASGTKQAKIVGVLSLGGV